MFIPRRTLWRSQPQYPVRNPDWVLFNAPTKGIELPAGSRPINVALANAPGGVYANANVSTTGLVTGLKIANDASAPLSIAGRAYRLAGDAVFAIVRGSSYGWALRVSDFDANQCTFRIYGVWKGTVTGFSATVPWPRNSGVDFAVNIQWLSRATYNHFGFTAYINGIRYTGEGDADHADTMNRFDVNVGCMFVGYRQALLSEDELLALSLDSTLLFPPRDELIFLPDAGGIATPILSAPSFAGRVPSVTITH